MTETPERPETALEREARSLDDYANEVESEMTEAVLRGAAKRLRALASSPVSQEAPTDADVEWIEEEVGMGAGAWDMVNTKAIVAACWKRLRSASRENAR